MFRKYIENIVLQFMKVHVAQAHANPVNVAIKECPECKHRTMMDNIHYFNGLSAFSESQYICLTCGSRLRVIKTETLKKVG
jgi:transposase-like protein